METIQNNRLVRRFFKCTKCKEIEAKLVNPFINNIYCSKCSGLVNEISETNYKKYKNKLKQKENIKEKNNQIPYKPKEDLLKKIPEKYNNKPTSSTHHHKKNDKHNNNNKKSNRHQSSTHYSNINFNNINSNHYNNINNNINNINNINIINENNNYGKNKKENRDKNRNTNRRREHSTNPNNHHYTNNFFSDFFGGMGFQPFMEYEFSIETPFINNINNHNPFRITVQRQNVSNDIFDPIFSSFGSIFNGIFQDNFSSNFSSNYRGNFFNEIIRILERNQAEAKKKAHPPASEESLNKLKKFNMNEKYCKKDKKGKYELPNCCICLSEIGKGEKTVLLPCGHMFHWKCCLTWLKSNNTCPMCRFEIK